MSKSVRYDREFKTQAVKLAVEVGPTKAANDLKLSKNTVSSWLRDARTGRFNVNDIEAIKEKPLSASEKLAILEKSIKEKDKKINELEEMNQFLEEACAFFAASRQKFAKKKD